MLLKLEPMMHVAENGQLDSHSFDALVSIHSSSAARVGRTHKKLQGPCPSQWRLTEQKGDWTEMKVCEEV